MRTYAWNGVGRIVRIAQRVEALVAAVDRLATALLAAEAHLHLLPVAAAATLRISSGTWCNCPGPTTRSTYGARSKTVRWSFCAMQPITPMTLFGCRLLGVLQPAQRAVDLVFGMLANAARVEQNRVGVRRVGGQFVALLAKRGHHQLAVEHVHLATDGFDVESWASWRAAAVRRLVNE